MDLRVRDRKEEQPRKLEQGPRLGVAEVGRG